MLLGRVVGSVVPAVVYAGLEGVPLLLVQLGEDAPTAWRTWLSGSPPVNGGQLP